MKHRHPKTPIAIDTPPNAVRPWLRGDPVVCCTISEPDQMNINIYGLGFTPPEALTPLGRASFGPLMDHLYATFKKPFTVEIIESDGTRRTGTIDLGGAGEIPTLTAPTQSDMTPPPKHADPVELDQPEPPVAPSPAGRCWRPSYPKRCQPTPPPAPTPPPPPVPARPAHSDDDDPAVTISGEGFAPDEPVLVAIVIGNATADPAGVVNYRLLRRVAALASTGETVIAGQTTGTMAVLSPLARP